MGSWTGRQWRRARLARADLARRFPAIIHPRHDIRPRLPLAFGIAEDMIDACPEMSKRDIELGVRLYTRTARYYACLVAGEPRHGLNGPDGTVVTPEQQERALERLRDLYDETRARSEATAKLAAQLGPTLTPATLNPDNHADIVHRVSDNGAQGVSEPPLNP